MKSALSDFWDVAVVAVTEPEVRRELVRVVLHLVHVMLHVGFWLMWHL